ncbi:MAG: DUF2950 family protein [Planctomycetota bacterium]
MRAALLMAAAAGLILASCRSVDAPAAQERPAALATFASPDAAFASLVDAARTGSVDGFEPLLGPEAASLIGAEDGVALRSELEAFVEGYDLAHRIDAADGDRATLVLGEEDWPFPIPLVRTGDGWTFDVEEGAEEIVSRRIGRNELSAIEVCRAIGDAQEEYRARFGRYAARLLSSEEEQDGLYWPTGEGEAPSPLGELVAAAAPEGPAPAGNGAPAPYLGYRYRILVERGGSAPGGAGSYLAGGALKEGYVVLAWPAEYGSLGIMTFLMDRRGVVLERDLGERTDEIASGFASYDPTLEWEVCGD